MNLRGKRVLVTGAASGIGYECALAFAKRGASLVLSDIDAAGLEKARQAVAAAGTPCFAHVCNVASEASVATFAAAVSESVGAVDVLVNNAGVAFLGAFEETPIAEWRRILDVNVLGIVHCIDAFLPAMRKAGGPRKIVNVASLAGVAPAPNMSAYAASKHAVIGLSEVLALELYDTELSVKYYEVSGCHPRVVGEDVARAVEADAAYLFTGPMAKAGAVLARISRGLARRFTISGSRRSGYLP
jgi:NAD(P)-dependent dehydrogenase (short-subunit alcohol dehydrogenase family)